VGQAATMADATGGNSTFSVNSYCISNFGGDPSAVRPDQQGYNIITITGGGGTDTTWGIGSMIVITCVDENEWHVAMRAEPLGTGNTAEAIVFS
jgi:hypothetical protein